MTDIIDSVQLDDVGSGIVDLFEITLDDGSTLNFYAGLENGTDTVGFPTIDGTDINEYIAIPIDLSGIESASDGAQGRPTLTVANIIRASTGRPSAEDTTLQQEVFRGDSLSNEYFIGKKLKRRRTLIDNLVAVDAVPPGSPPDEFPRASYIIDRISLENNVMVSFELASPLDVEGVRIPSRVVVGKYCSWKYAGLYQTPSKGGCSMHPSSFVDVANETAQDFNQHFAFFDAFDRPCMWANHTDITGALAWGAGSYAKDVIVTHNGNWYRSNGDSNTTTPVLGGTDWQELVIYGDYDANQTYNYSLPPHFLVVFYRNRLWHPKKPVPKGESPPQMGDATSPYWKRIDVCGKTVNSCKLRFQYLPMNITTSFKHTAPSVDLARNKPLPFGGFPGTVKFR